jgi:hypothetical protein
MRSFAEVRNRVFVVFRHRLAEDLAFDDGELTRLDGTRR